jgi:hypothetical protein
MKIIVKARSESALLQPKIKRKPVKEEVPFKPVATKIVI